MKLSKLYAQDSHGNTRVWEIEVEGAKYRTISGTIDGEKVVSDWTTCIGKNQGKKNETSGEVQAELEAAAKHKKKMESGYFENIADISQDRFYQPMLAHKYDEHSDKLPDKILVSAKMDGIRLIIDKNGVFSRTGKELPALRYIRDELSLLFRDMPNLILDSEAYSHKFKNDFNKLVSLIKKTKDVSSEHIQKLINGGVQAWIFDMPKGGMLLESDPFLDRYNELCNIFKDRGFRHSRILRYFETTKKDIEQSHEHYISESFEGLMARHPMGRYENKRSYTLLKLKRFIDDEFEIVDIIEGSGNRSGMMGYVILKDKAGKIFKANSRGDEEFYRLLLMNKKKYIGKMATVRYQNLTPDEGVPRFGVIVDFDRTL